VPQREVLQTNVLARPSTTPSSGPSSIAQVFTDEDDHAFVQQRLALLYGVMGTLLLVMFLVGLVLAFTFFPERAWELHTNVSKLAHLVACAVMLAGAVICRGRTRPRWFLSVFDVVAMAKVGLLVSAIVYFAPTGLRVEFLGLPALVFVVALRAALVPSPPRWTAFVAIAAAPAIPVGAFLRARADPTFPIGGLESAHTVLAFSSVWTVISVVGATIISKVVYGLRAEVKSAMKLGQYTLEEEIGHGGMGSVHRARHALLRRPTAIKLLSPERTSTLDQKRFEREVQLTSMLTHPNTIAIYDFGHTRDGVFYYAMELLEGTSLEDLVEKEGPQPPSRVIHILLQMAGALAEAHEASLIHRDVKPANVFLTTRGGMKDFVKVLDFGLVKEVDPKDPSLSSTESIAGTPLYMAPESITDPGAIDSRVDLYAVGGVAYWLLTGTPPFEGTNLIEICSQHLHAPVEPPSKRLGRPIPEALEQIVLRCLAKKREDRPESARALIELLSAAKDSAQSDKFTRMQLAPSAGTS
jgi:eukaryotic-like serine/threonine-protein kinase